MAARQGRAHHHRATCALANKLARICYAVLSDRADYAGVPVQRKLRFSYTLAAGRTETARTINPSRALSRD